MTDKPITYPQTEEAIHIGDFDLGTCYGASEPTPASKNSPIISDRQRGVYLYHANCLELMGLIAEKHPQGCFDMIFADPLIFYPMMALRRLLTGKVVVASVTTNSAPASARF